MDEGKLDIILKTYWKHVKTNKTYLKKVMDTRTFKFLYWHIVAFVDFIVSNNPLERSPCIVFVQHQVKRTIKWLWRRRLTSSLGLRGRFSLNRMNCLDGLHINWRFVQVHCWRYEFRHLGKRSLVSLNRFLLLRTSTTWKVVQIHSSGYRLGFSLPSLDGSFLDRSEEHTSELQSPC